MASLEEAGTKPRDEFKLYIANLPEELTEEGVEQIFQKYGSVTGIMSPNGATWAYVSYGSYKEAEFALRDLHNKGPLYLKVAFAKEKESKKTPQLKSQEVEFVDGGIPQTHVPDFRYAANPARLYRTQPFVPPTFPRVPAMVYSPEEDYLYPVPEDAFTYNPYDQVDPYADTNLLWSRGRVTVTRDGKRHVSLGRGYTRYELPDRHPGIQTSIMRIYEKTQVGLYEYSRDLLQGDVGNCARCHTKTKTMCQKCSEFYCSRECQVADWPRHKPHCETIPNLVTPPTTPNAPTPNSTSSQPMQKLQQALKQPLLRRPRQPITKTVESNGVEKPTENLEIPTKPISMNGVAKVNGFDVRDLEEKLKISSPEKTKEVRSEISPIGSKVSPVGSKVSLDGSKVSLDGSKVSPIGSKAPPVDSKVPLVGSKVPPVDSKVPLVASKVPPVDSKVPPVDSKVSPVGSEVKKVVEKKQKEVEAPMSLPKAPIQERVAKKSESEEFLSKSTFTDVIIQYLEPDGSYWVQRCSDMEDIQKLMMNLQHVAQASAAVKDLKIGKRYAMVYDSIWHRVSIMSLNPTKVHFIDYGNDEIAETNDLRSIGQLEDAPVFAKHIRIVGDSVPNQALTVEEVISVKALGTDEKGIISVEMEPKQPGPFSSSLSSVGPKPADTNLTAAIVTSKQRNIVDVLRTGDEGALEVHAALGNSIYGATLIPQSMTEEFVKIFEEFPKTYANMEKVPDYSASLNSMVAGRRPTGEWIRGYIVKMGPPIKLAAVDEARVTPVEEIQAYLIDYANIPYFGVSCQVIDTDRQLKPLDQLAFKVINQKESDGANSSAEIMIVLADGTEVRAFIKSWTPSAEQKGVSSAKIKSGTEIILTSYRNQNVLYARSLEPEEAERFNRVMQDVAHAARTASPLISVPVPGQMVLAKFDDDNYYRAIVRKVEGETASITYLDYGNYGNVPWKKLLNVPENLKEKPSCTARILLKDVKSEVPMTKKADEYFRELLGKEVPLICTFEGIPSIDGVFLKTVDNELVNTKVSQLLEGSWKNEDSAKDTRCFMAEDLKVAPLGEVGQTVEVVKVYYDPESGCVMLGPYDMELYNHIAGVMSETLHEYCTSISDHYIPRDMELCLAPYSGVYYRGLCLKTNETPTTSRILFVDYGNQECVNHKDIRMMKDDFMKPEAFANICILDDMGQRNENGEPVEAAMKKISDWIAANDMIRVTILNNESPGMYTVDIPELRELLVKEGLAKSK